MTTELIGPFSVGDVVDDVCKVTDFLGQGYASYVYEARLLRPCYGLPVGSTVAVKVYKEHMISDQTNVERIRRESRFGKWMAHPNIMRIFDLQDFSYAGKDRLCLIMERIHGQTLGQFLQEKSVSFDKACRLMEQLLVGLSEFHRANHIHRDIKPANLMIDDHGQLKIMDFGVIKPISEPTITKSTEFLGTIRYAAPELLFGKEYDHRVDIYSAGAVFYEMLSGKPILSDYQMFSNLIVEKKNWEPKRDSWRDLPVFGTKPVPDSENIAVSSPGEWAVADSLTMFLAQDPEKRLSSCDEALDVIRNRDESKVIAMRYPSVFNPELAAQRKMVTRGGSPGARKKAAEALAYFFSEQAPLGTAGFLDWFTWVAKHDRTVSQFASEIEGIVKYERWKHNAPDWVKEILREGGAENRLKLLRTKIDEQRLTLDKKRQRIEALTSYWDVYIFDYEDYREHLKRLREKETSHEIRSVLAQEVNYVKGVIDGIDDVIGKRLESNLPAAWPPKIAAVFLFVRLVGIIILVLLHDGGTFLVHACIEALQKLKTRLFGARRVQLREST